MENILLKNISTYKNRYDYYDYKGNEEKCNEYLALLLSEIESLLVLKGL